jgi:hypothetical protein
MKYFGHIKHHEGSEKRIMEGYKPIRMKWGRPERRWIQDITDELQMSASDAGHLAYDRVFRRFVKGSKF